jgi:TrmH family RNA methyltransferase
MKQITSRDNAFFKGLRALATDHREPRRRGESLADGIHLVSVCLERGVAIRQMIVSDSGLRKPEIAALAGRVQATTEAECLVLGDALFREATGVDTPVGVAAVIAIPSAPEGALAGDAVLLDAVQDAGNVGAILRTAAAAGVCDVVLGTGCAGAWTPRVLRAGQGAHFSLQIREQADLAATLTKCSGMPVATVAREGVSLYALDLTQPIVWLFGNEGAGLSPALVAAARQRVTIPLAASTESLNVAATAAVCLFEAARQRQ